MRNFYEDIEAPEVEPFTVQMLKALYDAGWHAPEGYQPVPDDIHLHIVFAGDPDYVCRDVAAGAIRWDLDEGPKAVARWHISDRYLPFWTDSEVERMRGTW